MLWLGRGMVSNGEISGLLLLLDRGSLMERRERAMLILGWLVRKEEREMLPSNIFVEISLRCKPV